MDQNSKGRAGRVRLIGVLGLLGIGLIGYGGVWAAVSRPAAVSAPVMGAGTDPRLLAGTTPPVTVSRPTGQTTFNVTFPAAFRSAPTVVLTVAGGDETPVSARLTGAATATGFQGIVTAPYFINRRETASVVVNWMALGESVPQAR